MRRPLSKNLEHGRYAPDTYFCFPVEVVGFSAASTRTVMPNLPIRTPTPAVSGPVTISLLAYSGRRNDPARWRVHFPMSPRRPPSPNKPTDGGRFPGRAADTTGALQGGAGDSAFSNHLHDGCGAIWQTASFRRLL